ncbi:hypothetical protein RCO28_38300 [Streptomyces sp. LHD-70]|uniref:hypothetical protein n=1 Tax=Streptomyces sp. LHD-70 TaxID=3072140 RepID=UPI00280F5A0A|nr:hypothetical protein [Streptomyces sp. LHD-70]MDQ8708269.1 hypothetical protein [Streptomyces sp. LHD-70]
MSRRVSLPGADELFRTTGGMALQASSPKAGRRQTNGEVRVPAPAGESDAAAAAGPASDEGAKAEAGAPAESGESTEHTTAEAESGSGEHRSRGGEGEKPGERSGRQQAAAANGTASPSGRRRGRAAARRPSGRERHDEKITVYVSAEELMDLEHARLVLRGEHGLAVDRGRIVREAVAVVLADLESRGEASILVRRLRGR